MILNASLLTLGKLKVHFEERINSAFSGGNALNYHVFIIHFAELNWAKIGGAGNQWNLAQ